MNKCVTASGMLAAVVCAGMATAQPCTPTWDVLIGNPGVDNPPVISNPFLETSPPDPEFPGYVSEFLPITLNGQESLLIGGAMSNIGGVEGTWGLARWDGTTFHPFFGGVPSGRFTTAVNTMIMFNGDLYVGGMFDQAGTPWGLVPMGQEEPDPPTSMNLWRFDFDTETWHGMNTGQTSFDSIHSMLVWDSGNGPELYVAGRFKQIAGVPALSIAKFDGTTWTQAGNGLHPHFDTRTDPPTNPGEGTPSTVYDLIVHNDGSGDKLYASGTIFFPNAANTTVVGRPVVVLNTTTNTWDPVGAIPVRASLATQATSMVSWDYGQGPRLIVGARLQDLVADGAVTTAIYQWDGVQWRELPLDPERIGVRPNRGTNELLVFNDGTGEALYAFGGFATTNTGLPLKRIARFTPTEGWTEYAGGVSLDGTTNFSQIIGAAVWNGHLYIGGSFTRVGPDSLTANRIARLALCPDAPPACPADFDNQNGVQVADIFAFLRAWFANAPSADFDQMNGIQVADIFSFLRAWFAGCP